MADGTKLYKSMATENYTFPDNDGSANQVLSTNGSGALSFVDQSGGSTANTFCRVTFGEGNGGEGNYTVGSFNIINFRDLAFYTKVDPGINYVEGPDGDGNTDYYLVPVSGYYLIILSLRTTDSSPEQDIGIGVNVDILLGGSNMGYDSPSFHWGRVQATTGGDASGRETHQDTQLAHFNAGDHMIAFAYSDTSALGVSDGSMSIVLLFPD